MARIAGITKQESEEKILNAALYCLAHLGDKDTTFKAIASRAGVSPALVNLYFKSRDELLPKVLEFVIEAGRQDTVNAVKEASTPVDKLKAYFHVSVEFFRATPERAKIYLQLYHLATFDENYRIRCREVKEVAVKRIEAILDAGEKAGQFRIKNRALMARTIHTGVIGLLLSLMSTEQNFPDRILLQQFEEMILNSIKA